MGRGPQPPVAALGSGLTDSARREQLLPVLSTQMCQELGALGAAGAQVTAPEGRQRVSRAPLRLSRRPRSG